LRGSAAAEQQAGGHSRHRGDNRNCSNRLLKNQKKRKSATNEYVFLNYTNEERNILLPYEINDDGDDSDDDSDDKSDFTKENSDGSETYLFKTGSDWSRGNGVIDKGDVNNSIQQI
jgi:hypothetical protein